MDIAVSAIHTALAPQTPPPLRRICIRFLFGRIYPPVARQHRRGYLVAGTLYRQTLCLSHHTGEVSPVVAELYFALVVWVGDWGDSGCGVVAGEVQKLKTNILLTPSTIKNPHANASGSNNSQTQRTFRGR